MLALAHGIQSQLLSLIGQLRYELLERRFIHTIRIGIVATTLLLTLFTAATIAVIGPEGFGLVIFFALGFVLILMYNHMRASVMLLMVTTTVLAIPLPRDMTTTLLLLIVLSCIWLIRLLIIERSFASLVPALHNRIIPLWIIAVIISYFWSNAYVDPNVRYLQEMKAMPRLVTGLVMILSPMALLLFANFIRSMRAIKGIIVYLLIYSIPALLPGLFWQALPANFNVGGQLSTWACLFGAGQFLYNKDLKHWQKLFLLALIGVWSYVQIGKGVTWLSGWIPLVMGFGVILFLWSRTAFVILALAVGLYAGLRMDYINSVLEQEQQESGFTRVAAADEAITFTNQHFLFGTGPTGYHFYMTYYIGGLFQLSHNNYVDVYAQTGVVGFVIWIVLWGSIGWSVWQTYKLAPKTGFERGLAVSLLAIYVCILVLQALGDWLLPFTYTQTMRGLSYTIWPWLWMGMATAFGHILRTSPKYAAQQTAA